MNEKDFLLVKAKMETEMENINNIEQELKDYGVFPELKTDNIRGFSLDDKGSLRILGSALHDYYNAVENIFKTIAQKIDSSLPEGSNWHKELLDQMVLEVYGIRPRVTKARTKDLLEELLAFRHVFRNVYGYNLTREKIEDLIRKLPDLSLNLKKDLKNFEKKMMDLLDL